MTKLPKAPEYAEWNWAWKWNPNQSGSSIDQAAFFRRLQQKNVQNKRFVLFWHD
jgi:hypothetical protein